MHLQFTFKRYVLLAGKRARAFAICAGLTPQRADMLLLLRNRSLVQRDIGTAFCVCPSVITRMVTALEREGLVVRRIPEEDRRLRIVSLTEKGRAALEPLFDDMLGEDDGVEIEACGEWMLQDDWKEAFEEAEYRRDPTEWRDQTELICTLVSAIRRTDYLADCGTTTKRERRLWAERKRAKKAELARATAFRRLPRPPPSTAPSSPS
jgi:DNA-binding MarR family transcriptional regulator